MNQVMKIKEKGEQSMPTYFYQFLESISEDLAQTAKELEGAIYNSPRSMLTHSRTFIEAILTRVMVYEKMDNEPYLTIRERIQDLEQEELLSNDLIDALNEVRKLGNMAAHDTRQFRYSESLMAWENLYIIVKWYVEVYGSAEIEVPEYIDPVIKPEASYDLEEMSVRFEKIEALLKQSIESERHAKQQAQAEVSATVGAEATADEIEQPLFPKDELTDKKQATPIFNEAPGLTPVRTITYGDDSIDIPYFLRDAFLLPQRFEQSERFLVRMGGAEEARIMSELPLSLENFHEKITRYNESHSEMFFDELKLFIQEEIRRRMLMKNRPGELFLFYDADEIIVTDNLAKLDINTENFTGMPSLINQLHDDGIYKVSDLPKELVIIGKYQGVGKGRVESFLRQLKTLQGKEREKAEEV